MRKLIYYVACTLDRFIARQDGSFEDFPTDGEHMPDLVRFFPDALPAVMREPLGIRGNNPWFDVVLMGRRTYEVGQKFGMTSPYPHLKQYLFSRSMAASPDPNVVLVTSGAVDLVKELKRQPGKDIWLCGGADLATALFGEIDELILKVNPFLLGSGIPLFSAPIPKTDVELLSSETYRNGFVRARYRVMH